VKVKRNYTAVDELTDRVRAMRTKTDQEELFYFHRPNSTTSCCNQMGQLVKCCFLCIQEIYQSKKYSRRRLRWCCTGAACSRGCKVLNLAYQLVEKEEHCCALVDIVQKVEGSRCTIREQAS